MAIYVDQSISENSLAVTGKDIVKPFDPSSKYKIGDRFSKDGATHKVIAVNHKGIFTVNEVTLQQLQWAW